VGIFNGASVNVNQRGINSVVPSEL
jgi:hypothetical protein